MSDITDIKPYNNVNSNQQTGAARHTTDPYSIYFSQCTQDEIENNIDVMWDWNSPQSKPHIRKHKRSDVQQSPKLPIKRQPSNSHINGFNKLREELETLRDHIVENIDTGTVSNTTHTVTKCGILAKDLEDVFNDSMEEQLLVCSQEVEYKYINEKPLLKDKQLCSNNPVTVINNHNNNQPNDTFNTFNNGIKKNITISVLPDYSKDNTNKIADDSFDFILETLSEEDLHSSEPLTVADTREHHENQYIDDVHKCTVQEIDRKRMEALSKLEGKKKQIASDEVESPIKCSPEEIEQKRLQALAKLEAKKKDIIERNRLQAIKRLEENKRKRALHAQTSLPRKIHKEPI